MAEYMSKLVQCTSDMTATTIAKMEAEGYTLHGVVYGDFGLRHMHFRRPNDEALEQRVKTIEG